MSTTTETATERPQDSDPRNPLQRWVSLRTIAQIDLMYLAIGVIAAPAALVLVALVAYLVSPFGVPGGPSLGFLGPLGALVGVSFAGGLFRLWLAAQLMMFPIVGLVVIQRLHDDLREYGHTVATQGYAEEHFRIVGKLYESPKLELQVISWGSLVMRVLQIAISGIAAIIVIGGVFPMVPAKQLFLLGASIAVASGIMSAMPLGSIFIQILALPIVVAGPALLGTIGLIPLAFIPLLTVYPVRLHAGNTLQPNPSHPGDLIHGPIHEDGATPAFYRFTGLSPNSPLLRWIDDLGTWLKTTRAIELASAKEMLSDGDWTNAPMDGQVVRGGRLSGFALFELLQGEKKLAAVTGANGQPEVPELAAAEVKRGGSLSGSKLFAKLQAKSN